MGVSEGPPARPKLPLCGLQCGGRLDEGRLQAPALSPFPPLTRRGLTQPGLPMDEGKVPGSEGGGLCLYSTLMLGPQVSHSPQAPPVSLFSSAKWGQLSLKDSPSCDTGPKKSTPFVAPSCREATSGSRVK